MADYALLDQLGVGKEFNFRYEIAKYRGCGLSDQELEEEGSDIVLMSFLDWDRSKYSGADFYSYCRKQLRGLLRIADKRGQVTMLSALGDVLEDDVFLDPSSLQETESLSSLIDARFMENISAIFSEIFSGERDKKYLDIAMKYYVEGKRVRAVASEMGYANHEGVVRYLKTIRCRFAEYVRCHKDRIYSYFDEPLADAIIDFAKA